MESLVGTVYSSGVIEFLRENNLWAFRAIKAGMKTASGRVVLDPKKAPIELELTEKLDASEIPWLERLRLLLGTADRVYLRPGDQALRFLQSTHELPKGQKVITLGDQSAVDDYANENWHNLRYFYAKRCDGFRFDIKKIFSHRDQSARKSRNIEIETRLARTEEETITHIMFDATGSSAHNDIIEWRGTIGEGDTGRFMPEDSQILLNITQVRQPLTFWYEYRDEFKSHAYEFEGDGLSAAMRRLEKKLVQLQDEREAESGDSQGAENEDAVG